MSSQTFTSEGTFEVPEDVSVIAVTLVGERGSISGGGSGNTVTGELATTPGEILHIGTTEGGVAGGNGNFIGGSAWDIRQGGDTLEDRVAVAGGGGTRHNAWSSNLGGDAGLPSGEKGDGFDGGGGGTQTEGGEAVSSFAGDGTFGFGGDGREEDRGAAGGAGWYGGGGNGGVPQSSAGGGGGGSSYVGGISDSNVSVTGASYGNGSVTLEWVVPPTLEGIVANPDGSLSLSWGDTGADEYAVYRSDESGIVLSDYDKIATVSSPSYVDEPGGGEQWFYVVTSIAGGNESGASNEQSATAVLPAPTGVTVSNVGFETADIEWTLNSFNEDRVIVEVTSDGGETWDESATLDPGTQSHTVTGLLTGRQQAIRVIVEVDE